MFVVANEIGITRSTVDEYDNVSVIAYFDRLNDDALPSQVMQAVELAHLKNPISDKH